jgi:hypothetical protein
MWSQVVQYAIILQSHLVLAHQKTKKLLSINRALARFRAGQERCKLPRIVITHTIAHFNWQMSTFWAILFLVALHHAHARTRLQYWRWAVVVEAKTAMVVPESLVLVLRTQ